MNQSRNATDGRYGFEGKWGRLCVCGHELGYHTGEAPHECINADRLNIGSICGLNANRVPPDNCDCRRFRPARDKGV